MNKTIQNKSYSRGFLRAYSVLIAAEKLLRMEELGLVLPPQEDHATCLNLNGGQNSIEEGEALIDKLYQEQKAFIKSHPIDEEQGEFVKRIASKILFNFFDKSDLISTKGVIAHLLYVNVLYRFFKEGKDANKIDSAYSYFTNDDTYNEIMDICENIQEYNWLDHNEAAEIALAGLI